MKKSLTVLKYSAFALVSLFALGNMDLKAMSFTEEEMPERAYIVGSYLFDTEVYDPTLAEIMLAAKTIAGSTLDDMKIYQYNYNAETQQHMWLEVSGTEDEKLTSAPAFDVKYLVSVNEDSEREEVEVPTSSELSALLTALVNEVNALTEADYTVSTWADLKKALALPETTDYLKMVKMGEIKAAQDTLVKKVDALALAGATITSSKGGEEYKHNISVLTITKRDNTIHVKANDSLKPYLNHEGGTINAWFGLLVDLGIKRENVVALEGYTFDGGEIDAAAYFGASNDNQFILWLTPDMNGKTITFADKTNLKNTVTITLEFEQFSALEFNGNFASDRVTNDESDPLYDVMKIAYDRKVVFDGNTTLTITKGDNVIWKEVGNKTVNNDAWFKWSFRDVSSILATLPDNIITSSGPQLESLERSNATLLKAGDLVQITITGIYQGKEYKITKSYTVTAEDIKNATYVKEETSVVEFNGDFATDRVINDETEQLYQVMKVKYDRKLALDKGVVFTVKKGNTVIWKEQGSKGTVNNEAWFTWSFRDVSSLLATLPNNIITSSGPELVSLERSNATLLKAGDVLEISITATFNGKDYTITEEYTVTAEDIKNATYVKEETSVVEFNGDFATDRVINDETEQLYQVMKVKYDRKLALDKGVVFTVKKGNTVIWKEQGSKGTVNNEAWFTWSFRDVSSLLATLPNNIITSSGPELVSLERSNATLLKAGDVLEISITATFNGKEYTITEEYTVTAEDIKNATYVKEETSVVEFNGDFATDRVINDETEQLYQVMKVKYDRKLALDKGVVFTVKKGNTVIWKEQGSKGTVNNEAWFTWSFRDVSSLLATLPNNIITSSGPELVSLERSNTTLLTAGDILEISITATFNGKEYTITEEYTVTAEDITNATYNG